MAGTLGPKLDAKTEARPSPVEAMPTDEKNIFNEAKLGQPDHSDKPTDPQSSSPESPQKPPDAPRRPWRKWLFIVSGIIGLGVAIYFLIPNNLSQAELNLRCNIQLQVQDQLAVAQGNIALNLINVYRALGGGWEIRNQDCGYCQIPNAGKMPDATAPPAAYPQQIPQPRPNPPPGR